MAVIKKIQIGGTDYDIGVKAENIEGQIDLSDYTLKSETGNLEELETEDKTNLVNAINEVASGSGGDCLENTLFANYNNSDTNIDFASILPEINEVINKSLGKATILNIFGRTKKVFYRFYLYKDIPTSTGGPYTDTITGYYIVNGGISQINLQQKKFIIKYDTNENGTINITQFYSDAQVNELTFKSEVLLKTNTTAYTPTADYHPATKKYVDDNAGGISIDAVKEITGELENLETEDKTNLVNAINELLNINTKDIPILSDSSITLKDLDDGIYNVKSSVATIRYNGNTGYNTGGYNGPMLVYKSQTSDIKYALWFQQLKSQSANTTNIVSFTTYSKQFTICNYTPANVGAVLTRTNTTAYTPTADYHPATKKYVDTAISDAITTTLGGEF